MYYTPMLEFMQFYLNDVEIYSGYQPYERQYYAVTKCHVNGVPYDGIEIQYVEIDSDLVIECVWEIKSR